MQMAGRPRKCHPPKDPAIASAQVGITQARYMIRIYAEIVAMDETIIERIRQLIVTQSDDGDRDRSLDNLRLLLAQLVKVGQRLDHWNARVRALVRGQLSRCLSSRQCHISGAAVGLNPMGRRPPMRPTEWKAFATSAEFRAALMLALGAIKETRAVGATEVPSM